MKRSFDVVRLHEDGVSDAVDVLCDAFEHYPVMHFVLDASRQGYRERLRRFVHFAVLARAHRGEFVFGIAEGTTLQGVATVSRPHETGNPPGLIALREELWGDLGAPLRARYEEYGGAIAPFTPPQPHLHINMLGVRHAAHGKGYAFGAVIDSVVLTMNMSRTAIGAGSTQVALRRVLADPACTSCGCRATVSPSRAGRSSWSVSFRDIFIRLAFSSCSLRAINQLLI